MLGKGEKVLQLKVLGEPTLVRDGLVLALPQSKKTRALFCYLALTARPHRRDSLVSMFWEVPDDPRGALRWSLTKIRGLVDEQGCRRLIADRESVAFQATDCEIDWLTARTLRDQPLDNVPAADLERAAEYFRGELLEGLDLSECHAFRTWQAAEREAARSARRRILQELLARYRQAPERALPHARTLSALDPYAEEDRRQLLRILVALGRLEEAEEHFRFGLQSLNELQMDDAPLRQFWNRLRGQRREARSRASPGAPPAAGAMARSGGMPSAEPIVEPESLFRRPAVAVLPFENMSDDPDQTYLADGITEDLITALSHWRWFPVIARSSSFAYKGQHKDVVSIGVALGARYLVQGSLRRSGDRVRVVAQLIDAERGHTLWAQRHDRDLGDVFALQDELTEQIVAHIEPELARAEHRRSENKPQQDLDAWDLNLRALAHIYRGRPPDFAAAHQLLDESLARDPLSSQTHAIRAFCLYHQALLVWTREDPSGPAAAYHDAAQQAVELDDSNWLAHALLGLSVLWSRRDYDKAAREEERAIALNPSAALAHQFLGCVHCFSGTPREAIAPLTVALRLNPGQESATLLLADLSLAHLLCGELDEAERYARRAISEFRGNLRAWQRLAAILGMRGKLEEAAAAAAELTRRRAVPSPAHLDMTYPFRTAEHRDILLEGLRRAGWSSQSE